MLMRVELNLCLLAITLALAACGPQPPEPVAKPAEAPKATNAAGVPATKHVIEAYDTMRYDKKLIEVPAGEQITLTLKNVGHMPKASMGHNLVILDLGRQPEAFMVEASFAKATDYIPAEHEDWIVAKTKLLGPGESDTITFTAPKTPGEYPFICSFPGHYAVGMKGIMRVVVEQ